MRTFIAVSIIVWGLCGLARAEEKKPATTQATTQGDLERQFAESMSGSTLVGKFTEERAANPRPAEAKEDRYTLTKVQKLYGDNWLFVARIQFGDKDVSVPIMLPVKWAGDTPVITVTDAKIPGMGTYTARVMIYRDEYAGTWSGGNHGGHLWGKIERAKQGGQGGPTTQPVKP
jgi:hypothetical protein